jgi:hypothetical protein
MAVVPEILGDGLVYRDQKAGQVSAKKEAFQEEARRCDVVDAT